MGYGMNIVKEVARTGYGPGTAVPDTAPDIADGLGDEIATLTAR